MEIPRYQVNPMVSQGALYIFQPNNKENQGKKINRENRLFSLKLKTKPKHQPLKAL